MRYVHFFMALVLFTAACTGLTENTNEGASVEQPINTGELKEFTVTARQFEFDPEIITVNKGDTVRLIITSTDVAHGIGIPDFGVNAELLPGETTTVEFVADRTGTFDFVCSFYCGVGHNEMKGTLIVK